MYTPTSGVVRSMLALVLSAAVLIRAHMCLHEPPPDPATTDLTNCAPLQRQFTLDPTAGKPVRKYRAGTTIDVQWRRPGAQRADRGSPVGQARHGGGYMEIALQFPGDIPKAIMRGIRNYPDVGVTLPVHLPHDLPSGPALFIFNWVPAHSAVPEFYSFGTIVWIEPCHHDPGASPPSPLSFRDACDAFTEILSEFHPRPDGHGNGPGRGFEESSVNYDGCVDGGQYPESRWAVFEERAWGTVKEGAAYAADGAPNGPPDWSSSSSGTKEVVDRPSATAWGPSTWSEGQMVPTPSGPLGPAATVRAQGIGPRRHWTQPAAPSNPAEGLVPSRPPTADPVPPPVPALAPASPLVPVVPPPPTLEPGHQTSPMQGRPASHGPVLGFPPAPAAPLPNSKVAGPVGPYGPAPGQPGPLAPLQALWDTFRAAFPGPAHPPPPGVPMPA